MNMLEKMIEKAEALEAQARVLREAAALMNGHQTAKKQGRYPGILAAAIKARNGHGAPDEVETVPADPARPVILKALANGPLSSTPLRQALAHNGIEWSNWKLARAIRKMPGVRLNETGRKYELTTGAHKPQPPTQADLKAASRAKMRILADILEQAGAPMAIKDLAAAAREKGVTSLTGIRGYVDFGWLRQHGKKGKFRYGLGKTTVPSEAAAAE